MEVMDDEGASEAWGPDDHVSSDIILDISTQDLLHSVMLCFPEVII